MRNEFNFDTLILIVGTNPLPNLVVAEYFINKNSNLKNILFIYEEKHFYSNQKGTVEYCENLERNIKSKHGNRNLKFIYVPLSDVHSPKEIRRDLVRRMSDRLRENAVEGIHLNYTDDTIMGIHVYHWFKEREKNVSCSYFDTRNFRIVDDEDGVITNDLRKEVKLTLDEVVELHGFKRKNINEKFKFTESLSKFKELIEQNKLPEFYEKYNRNLFLNRKGELIRKKSEIKEELRNMKAEEPLLSVVLALPEDYRLFNPDGSFRELRTSYDLEEAVEFIDGKWLEKYVHEIVGAERFMAMFDIQSEYRMDRTTYEFYEWVTWKEFEISAFMNGFQLIGIACTTSMDRRICKSKGFEILNRSKRIGGKMAKAILITTLDSEARNELVSKIMSDIGEIDSILILGERDLKQERLVEKISEFIE